MRGASGYISRRLPPHLRFLLFSNELPPSLTLGSAVETPQAAGLGPCSDQLADSVIPCSHPASIQRASLKEQISRRCCKCCADSALSGTDCYKIKRIHFQKESKNLFLPTISVLPLCSQSVQPFQPLATRAKA